MNESDADQLYNSVFGFGLASSAVDMRAQLKNMIESKKRKKEKPRDDEEEQQVDEELAKALQEDVPFDDDFRSSCSRNSTKSKKSKMSGSSSSSSSSSRRKAAIKEPDPDEEAMVFSNSELKAGPAAAPEAEDQWRYDEEFDETSDAVIADRKWCFLCKYSLAVSEADRIPEYRGILKIINDNHGLIGDLALCTMVQDFYNKHLRICTETEQPWAKASIYDHIYEHRPTPQRDSFKHLKRLKKIEDAIYQNLFDDAGKNVNIKGAEIYLKIIEKQEKLHKTVAEANTSKSLL